MEQWFNVDEETYRSSQDEQRTLLACWVEGDDVGGYGLHGVDHRNAGDIDAVISLNAQFFKALAACIEADQVAGKKPGPFEEAFDRVKDILSDDDLVTFDKQGVMHPTDAFTKDSLNVDDVLQPTTLSALLNWVFCSRSTSIEKYGQVGGASLCESSWTHYFVWTHNPTSARREIEANIARADRVLAKWTVKA
jgi:hypothetical protein